MTDAQHPEKVREARGVTDSLVRLSLGIEDLIADLDQAMEKA